MNIKNLKIIHYQSCFPALYVSIIKLNVDLTAHNNDRIMILKIYYHNTKMKNL